MEEQAPQLTLFLTLFLKTASHIGHPAAVAAFACVIAASVFALAFRAKRPLLAAFAAVGILVLGAAPFVASTILQSRGVYHIEVVLLRPDQSIADIAQVKSSTSAELKMVADRWQLDIPPQSRPADGKITFSASVKDEFLKGKSTLILAKDYYPTATIQLVPETSAIVRGVVVDEDLRAVSGATVSIEGHPEVAVTNQKGNFTLPAHAGNGQMVEVRAQKDRLTGHLSAPAGKTVEVILSSE